MAYTPGRFVWRELLTSDVEDARRFYGELFGWNWSAMPMEEGRVYWVGRLGEQGILGVMGLMGSPVPAWMSYLSVDDVDGATARVTELGGVVHMGGMDIPNVGRFSVVSDPTGATAYLYRDHAGDAEVTVDRPPLGSFCWETLSTTDPEAAMAFWQELAGWSRSDFAGMATMNAATGPVADVQLAQEGVPSHFMTFVAVADLDATVARVAGLGGSVIAPLIPVPGVGRMGILRDPQGAVLGVFQGE